MQKKVTPERWHYAFPVAIFITGLSIFILIFSRSLGGFSGAITQVVLPGKSDVILKRPGNYTVYYEYKSAIGDKKYSTGKNLLGLKCFLVHRESKNVIELSRATSNSKYTIGPRKGIAVLEFNIAEPGTYVFSGRYPERVRGRDVVMAISGDYGAGLMVGVLGGLGIISTTVMLSAGMAIMIYMKRQRAKEAM